MASKINPSQLQTPSILGCNNCGKTDVKLQLCARCHFVRYCNRECQIKDWSKHKVVCQTKEVNASIEEPIFNLEEYTTHFFEMLKNEQPMRPETVLEAKKILNKLKISNNSYEAFAIKSLLKLLNFW